MSSGPGKVRRVIYLTVDIDQRLRDRVEDKGVSMNEWINGAIEWGLTHPTAMRKHTTTEIVEL